MSDWTPGPSERVLVHFNHPEPCDVPATVLHVEAVFHEPPMYEVHVDGKRHPFTVPITRLRRMDPRTFQCCRLFTTASGAVEESLPRAIMEPEPSSAAEAYVWQTRIHFGDDPIVTVRVRDEHGALTEWTVCVQVTLTARPLQLADP